MKDIISKYTPGSFSRIDVSADSLYKISTYIKLATGFSHFSLVIREIYPITESSIYILDNYDKNWHIIYEKNKLWKIDPVIMYKPVEMADYAVWDELFFIKHEEIYSYSIQHGFQGGITFMLPLPQGYNSVLSFSNISHSITKREIERARTNYIKIYTTIVNSIILSGHGDIKFNQDKTELTNRELMILMLSVDGMTSAEIAEKLYISKSTVDFHILKIMKKLNCKNKFQAIAKALIIGII
jgi:LuxR family transcriptional regulator